MYSLCSFKISIGRSLIQRIYNDFCRHLVLYFHRNICPLDLRAFYNWDVVNMLLAILCNRNTLVWSCILNDCLLRHIRILVSIIEFDFGRSCRPINNFLKINAMNRPNIWMRLIIIIMVYLIIIIDRTGASLMITILNVNGFIDLKAWINIFDIVQTLSDTL